jgi:hypothetical protein
MFDRFRAGLDEGKTVIKSMDYRNVEFIGLFDAALF